MNKKDSNELYESGKNVNFDYLNVYLLSYQSSCTKIFFERRKKKHKKKLKKW